ncbi:MAG TPA: LLM class flavin-dependent oxidoreductase [Dehalococcoidia bacterium]|nr:LLM class flavin-dependent oxidoreductase [Dehalococcoidia bacterium]
MRVTIRVSPFAPVQEVVEFARGCEAAGFDGVGFLDSQMINRDVFVTLGQVAAATDRVHLATAVTNPVTRHVSVIASAAATVDDLAPGRVAIWIGRGFSATNLIGADQAKTRELGEAIRDLRRLIAGEWDVFPGTHSRMRTADRQIPVYLAAAGPRTIRLAGEVADGLLLAGSMLASGRERARQLAAEGARLAGRNRDEIDICHSLLTSIRESREEALRWAGPLIALRLNDEQWLREAGIETKGAKLPEGLNSLYPDPMHAEDHGAAMDMAEEIPLELRLQIAEKLGLIGTPEDCIARLRQLAAEGVDNVYMRTVDTVSFPQSEVDAYKDHIRPAIASFR